MQTIKTGLVIALLLAVCYGAFVALNAPDPDLPESVSEWVTDEQSLDDLVDIDIGADVETSLGSAVPMSAEELMASLNQPTAPPPAAGTAPQSVGVGGDLPAWPGEESATLPTAPSIDVPSIEAPALDSGDASSMNNALPDPSEIEAAVQGTDTELATSIEPFPPLPGESAGLETSGDAGGDSMDLVSAIPVAAVRPAREPEPSLSPPPSDLAENPAQPTGGASPASSWNANATAQPFIATRNQALAAANSGKLREALAMLSPYYGSPELNHEETADLLDLLDALCREVIYSPRHLLEPAYTVQSTDTLASVASAHRVTPELLSAINGLGNSKALIPGSKLKVVRGPFRAVVFLGQSEMAVFLNDLYAGRFPIALGSDPAPQPGTFTITARQTDRTYYARNGVAIPGGDPRNPYGKVWLSFGEYAIHGTAEMVSSDLSRSGCISLAPLDARDVYNILVVGSPVEVRP
ncbi:MAG: LysM peptidoglycan-binding domain-containing protein [Planctomycetota bacterium]|nr:MAG: LysM peptidoglycan-binding domain-containing protein [Planctomycetota bacterium]